MRGRAWHVLQFDALHHQLAVALKRAGGGPERTALVAFHQRRIACAREALARLSGPVEPQHEERQAALAHPLQSRETVRQLLETDPEAALEHRQIVPGRLARAQEPAIGHDESGSEIRGDVPFEQLARLLVRDLRTLRQAADVVAPFEPCELQGDLEDARRGR